jgi:hypothetical protein
MQDEFTLIDFLGNCEQKLDHIFLTPDKIYPKVLKDILEAVGLLIYQPTGKVLIHVDSSINHLSDDFNILRNSPHSI